jgi:Sugar (and other) transporter
MARTFDLALQPSRTYVDDRLAIVATSMGTVFEWYDFFLYGLVQMEFSTNFFGNVDPTTSFIFFLGTYSAGFVFRPLGAVIFGRLGDLWGRKYCFVTTIAIMGFATTMVGCLPPASTIGLLAPALVIVARLLQGLAIGGEYGGAAIYIAEYAPSRERGTYTALVQASVAFGLFLAVFIEGFCRGAMPAPAFTAWGWRIPFLLSAALLFFSVFIRLKLDESPVFEELRRTGRVSRHPLRAAFGNPENLKRMSIAVLGMTACQGVVLFTGLNYAVFFLIQTFKVDPVAAGSTLIVALLLGVPFFLIAGSISDVIGRKPLFIIGCLLAATTYFPIFHGLSHYANPGLEAAQERSPATIAADPASCAIQFKFFGNERYTSPCDVATAALTDRGISYTITPQAPGQPVTITIGSNSVTSYDATSADARALDTAFTATLTSALSHAGYPAKANPAEIDFGMITMLMLILILYVAMVYGPLAAMLVEMFPPQIRYTSFSVTYHIGIGLIGSFVTPIAFAIDSGVGNIFAGLWFPVALILISVVICAVFYREEPVRAR